jgi:uncharacterized protein YbjT (DUF2867 family)
VILVVGASGHVGGLICRELKAKGLRVRAMVRPSSNIEYVQHLGVETTVATLIDPDSLRGALSGCTTVICTASTISPTVKGESVPGDGGRIRLLVEAAQAAGVRRLVLVSTAIPAGGEKAPLFQAKIEAEQHVMASGLEYTILRPGKFMEVHLATFGMTLPLAKREPGLVHHLERPFPFGQRFFQSIKNDIVGKGIANISGTGRAKSVYVSSEDVARIAAACIDNPLCKNTILEFGTDPLTGIETVDLISKVLGRPLKIKRMPAFVAKLLGTVLRLVNPAAGALLLSIAGTADLDMSVDMTAFRQAFSTYRLQTIEEFLQERILLAKQIAS